jgi:radical SAM superfamily enzyme YgiQ (UPF0313 family)
MRVLLVNANRSRDLLPPPPVGLSYVASATADAGHEVRLFDSLLSRTPEKDLGHALREARPDVVGLSVRNLDNLIRQRARGQFSAIAPLIAAVREHSRAPVVLGGPAVSIAGAGALRRLDADYAVIGEGERSFVSLLAALERGGTVDGIPGLAHRQDGKAIANPQVHAERFGGSGMERWLDWKAYERIGSTWAIQTKRGCPLPCSYCLYGAIEGSRYRLRPPGEVADEMDRVWRKHRPRAFEIVDSTFNLPVDHAQAMCEEIARRGARVALTAQGVNPLGASPELFRAMKRASFNSFMVSAEAGCDAMLQRLGKGFSVDHVHATIQAARTSGMISLWFFMLGAPGETQETVEETISFAERWLDWEGCLVILFAGVRVLPRTAVELVARAEGQISPDDDLIEPRFYFSRDVDERWVVERIRCAAARRPNIVHAAEEDAKLQRIMNAVLSRSGVPPPHWRFLPRVLDTFPLRELRRLRPDFGRVG